MKIDLKDHYPMGDVLISGNVQNSVVELTIMVEVMGFEKQIRFENDYTFEIDITPTWPDNYEITFLAIYNNEDSLRWVEVLQIQSNIQTLPINDLYLHPDDNEFSLSMLKQSPMKTTIKCPNEVYNEEIIIAPDKWDSTSQNFEHTFTLGPFLSITFYLKTHSITKTKKEIICELGFMIVLWN